MKINIHTKYYSGEIKLQFAQYSNGRTAICLTDAVTGEPVMTATVNLPDEPLVEGEVIIKDWSENEGIMTSLMNAGVISDPIGTTYTGYVEASIHELLVTPITTND